VSGSARRSDSVDALVQAGFDAFAFTGVTPSDDLRRRLARTTHLLLSAAPDDRGDPVLGLHADDVRRAAQSGVLRWIGYLSTIAVYGDAAGGWVDEETPATPGSARGRRRVEAEAQWLALGRETGVAVQVFRIAGIYGPGRSTIDALRAGTAHRIIKAGQVFNRIHVADIAQVLAAAMAGRGHHAIYNLADDEPAPPQDVIVHAAELIGVPPPPEEPFETAVLSPMARSFYGEVKRVRNARIKDDLGVRLLYPTFREGLAALV
jgi:nucleoside-diphosphate-sugar epimerase